MTGAKAFPGNVLSVPASALNKEKSEKVFTKRARDPEGLPTTNASAALDCVLLPAGGARGASLALMVEILAAGLCGAEWSVNAHSALEGAHSPLTGLFALAIHPGLSGDGTVPRINRHLHRLADEFGVYLPGERRQLCARKAQAEGFEVDAPVYAALKDYAGSGSDCAQSVKAVNKVMRNSLTDLDEQSSRGG